MIRFEGFELNPAARSLTREGRPIAISSRTFELLWHLARHPHQVVSKDELMTALWPDSFVEEGNLTQQIFLLRKALAAGGRGDRIVVTVPGKGYQFAATIDSPEAMEGSDTAEISFPPGRLASESSESSVGELRTHTVQSVTRMVIEEETDDGIPSLAAPRRNLARRYWLVAAGTLIALAAGSILVWRHLHQTPASGIDLVLSDFENRTNDPDFDHTLNQALQIISNRRLICICSRDREFRRRWPRCSASPTRH